MARRLRRSFAALLVAAALGTIGCGQQIGASPEPTPMDFPGLAGAFAQHGIYVDHFESGDAGCADPTLVGPAIGFDATGPGVESPVRVRIYIFGSAAAYDRRRADVDTCVAAWTTDPATVQFIDARPFVLAGQGPWPTAFTDAMRAALVEGAGNGG